MRPPLLRWPALAGPAVIATMLGCPVGFAASRQPAAHPPADRSEVRYGAHPGGAPFGPARRNDNIDGGNWSGYVAQGNGFTSVTTSWTEPAVTCNSTNDLFAPWVGIDGYASSTVEQTGVATDCSSGTPTYQGWYEMYPAAPVYYSNPVNPGDAISATVTRSGSSYTLTLSDQTTGWSKTTTKSLPASNLSAEVVIESPAAAYPDFGVVNFSGSAVDSQDLSAYDPVALDASNAGGYEDRTGPLAGGSFSITYVRE